MKKILLVMSVAILMAICSAPLFVKADEYEIGLALYYRYNDSGELITLYTNSPGPYSHCYNNSGYIYAGSNMVWFYNGSSSESVLTSYVGSIYIDDLTSDADINYASWVIPVFSNYSEFVNSIPENLRPVELSQAEQRWSEFYEWFHDKFGYYPREGSLIDLIRLLAIGDWTENEEVEITFPTTSPPTPTPTPIPVQTIFVPDGNGNTTIIYQYTDPTTGVITQSPYNPNIDLDINCGCDGGQGNNTFGVDPSDPTALTSSMLWADGFGVQITDNPLTAANNSQQTLADAAAEYSDSVNVVSNSFNVLPFKWLTLIGLLGGILIIAGLIRTFLGG